MKTAAWALLACLLLAGCSKENDPSDEGTPTTSPTMTQTTTQTPAPPHLSLSADILNGTAPLRVDFTLSGGGFPADATWSLDSTGPGGVNVTLGQGLSLPATVNWTFQAPGLHNVTLSMGNATVSKTSVLAITVEGEPVPAGPTDLVVRYEAKGAFAAEATESQHVAIDVPAGARALTLWTDWDGGTPLLPNSAYPNDIDLFLHDPSGKEVATAETLGFEYMRVQPAGGLAAGTWDLEVAPFDVPRAAAYTVQVLVWLVDPVEVKLTGDATGHADLGEGTDTFRHDVDLPDVQTVEVYLRWNSATSGYCSSATTRTNDLDMAAYFGGKQVLTSGYFHSCEYDHIDGAASLGMAGTWTIEVAPYYSTTAAYEAFVLYA